MTGNISPITDRRDINVGHFCNQRCKFCYYRHDVNSLNFLFNVLSAGYVCTGVMMLINFTGENRFYIAISTILWSMQKNYNLRIFQLLLIEYF